MAGLPPRSSWEDDSAGTDNLGGDEAAATTGATAPAPASTPTSTPTSMPTPTVSAELDRAPATAPRQPSPARWSPTVRPDRRLPRGIDPATWPVGFSPTGEALPETLTDVLLRGSHAIRSSKRAEALRLERAAAIAEHVEAQIQEFLAFCAAEALTPPVTVRATGRRPERAHDGYAADPVGPRRYRGRVGTIGTTTGTTTGTTGAAPAGTTGTTAAAGDGAPGDGCAPREAGPREVTDPPAVGRHRGERPAPASTRRRPLRRERLHAWPLLYWRCESFPAPGRSLHLFVEPGGRTFEGRDDPAPLTVLGREVQVWQVDAPAIVESMAE
ncbi:hypothetical protein, partial [Frankia sp. EI5c]|uniref:hypothetical protein n=1 Tax=Frankia sp. EI5c TaxID=683316 RepID=UPI001F5B5C1A